MPTKSTLFRARSTGAFDGLSLSAFRMSRSSSSSGWDASTTQRMTSASAMACKAARTSPWLKTAPEAWIPGVSRKRSCAWGRVLIPRIRCQVVCGRGEMMLSFCWSRRFTSVDFPTFGRPTMAT